MARLEKEQLRKFNQTLPNGDRVYLGWIEDDQHYVFQKEMTGKNSWNITYSEIRVHHDDLFNGNFEYMISHNLTRFD